MAQPLAAQATAAGTQPAASSTSTDETKLLIPGGTSPATASGAQTAPAATVQGGGGVSTWDFLRMLLILVGVVLFIYLLFWLLRKGSKKKIQENEIIKVLGSRTLSGNRALHLVEVGSNVFLVGSSEGGVQLISEISEKESLDSVRLKASEQPAVRRTFQTLLSEIFKPAAKPFSVGDGVGILRGQRDRLKKL